MIISLKRSLHLCWTENTSDCLLEKPLRFLSFYYKYSTSVINTSVFYDAVFKWSRGFSKLLPNSGVSNAGVMGSRQICANTSSPWAPPPGGMLGRAAHLRPAECYDRGSERPLQERDRGRANAPRTVQMGVIRARSHAHYWVSMRRLSKQKVIFLLHSPLRDKINVSLDILWRD